MGFPASVARTWRRIDAPAATLAGLAAGAAFVAVMEADLRLTGRHVDDRIFLGRPLVPDRPEAAKGIGTLLHFLNAIGFAWLYALLEARLPGPPWAKGVLFFNLENVVLYPLTALDRKHPAVRDGQIDRYFTWPAFLQSIPRHVAYGAVLGVLYDRRRRRR